MHKHIKYHINDYLTDINDMIRKKAAPTTIIDLHNIYKQNTKEFVLYNDFITILKNYNTIKNDVTDIIKNFVDKNGTIRDLIYRMNAISPIEREYRNRAFKVNILTNGFNSNSNADKIIGCDETNNDNIMNHEIEAIVLFLLAGSNNKIKIQFDISTIFKFLSDLYTSKHNYNNDELLIVPEGNIRYLLMRALSCDENFSFSNTFTKNDIKNNIKNKKDNTFGYILYNDKTRRSLSYTIMKLYYDNNLFTETINYNLTRLPTISNYIMETAGINVVTTESFRKLLYNLFIIYYELLLFNFMSFTMKIEKIDNITRAIDKINNPIDRKLWYDRKFQGYLLYLNERYNNNKLFDLFDKYLKTKVIEGR